MSLVNLYLQKQVSSSVVSMPLTLQMQVFNVMDHTAAVPQIVGSDLAPIQEWIDVPTFSDKVSIDKRRQSPPDKRSLATPILMVKVPMIKLLSLLTCTRTRDPRKKVPLLPYPGDASRQEVFANLPRNVDGSPHDAPAMTSQQAWPAGHTALAFATARSKS